LLGRPSFLLAAGLNEEGINSFIQVKTLIFASIRWVYIIARQPIYFGGFMKKFLLSFLAIFFPGIIFVLEGRLEFAVFAFAMQASVIGWIPISVVAWKHREALGINSKKSEKAEEPTPEEPVQEEPAQEKLDQEKLDKKD